MAGLVVVDAMPLVFAGDVGVVVCGTVVGVAAVVVNLVVIDALVIVDSIICVVVTVSRGSLHVVVRVSVVGALAMRMSAVGVLFNVTRAPEDAIVLSVRVIPGASVVSLVFWRIERGFVVVFTDDLVNVFVDRVTVGK